MPLDTNGTSDIFVHDRTTGATTRASVASDGAQGLYGGATPEISADGNRVVFLSDSPNLVPGDTNQRQDVFVHDRPTGVTMRANVASDGTQANGHSSEPTIASGGRFVAFSTHATNLVGPDTDSINVIRHDLLTGVTDR